MALRPCIQPGCPELTARTRCTLHERQRDYARNAPYQDSRWKRLRVEVVKAGRCYWCGVTGKRLVADHVTPISQGGEPYDRSNVVSACYSCNRRRVDE